MTEFRDGKILTEGDELYYKVRGRGKALLFIAPGGGNGDDYLQVADRLAADYRVITYDRRNNSRSTGNYPEDFSIAQQSRDGIAVLEAVGENQAVAIGNSSGAVIALDLAGSFPQAIYGAVLHEAPLPYLLPQAAKWQAFFTSCYQVGKQKGASAGATKFFFGIQMPAFRLTMATMKARKYATREKSQTSTENLSSAQATAVLIFNELLPITSYQADLPAIKAENVKIIVACGQYGLARKAWYSEVAHLLAEQLGGEVAVFPGHHGSFMDQPDVWAEALRENLQKIGW